MKNSLNNIRQFLEKYRISIIIICTFSNFAIFIMMAGKILGNKETMAWTSFTGPFGDTFSGIVSPLIGLVSMYLIYKTFQAQTKQLEDQEKTNKRQRQEFKHTILLQKKELDDQKKTNSLSNDAFYFQQARLVITEVLNKFDKISTNVLWLSLSSGRGNLEGIDILKYFSSFETNIVDIQDEQYDALDMFHLKFKGTLTIPVVT